MLHRWPDEEQRGHPGPGQRTGKTQREERERCREGPGVSGKRRAERRTVTGSVTKQSGQPTGMARARVLVHSVVQKGSKANPEISLGDEGRGEAWPRWKVQIPALPFHKPRALS